MISAALRKRLEALEKGYSSPRLVSIAMQALSEGRKPTSGPSVSIAQDFVAFRKAIDSTPGAFPARLDTFAEPHPSPGISPEL